jgi:SAM-dependent methyltransferase
VLDPTRRFSNRVENYIKYRPTYPAEIVPLLKSECGLTANSLIADIGSGTGFFAQLFLRNGNPVIGVEPNPEMRAAGEKLLAGYPGFSCVSGTAEATTLAGNSVDFVTAAQAFHWFNHDQTRAEFLRILKPDGWAVIAWNGYRAESSPLMAAYQDLVLRYGTDYLEVRREVEACDVEAFFAPGTCKCARFEFSQGFDHEGLKGRLLSSSFVPEPGEPNYEAMLGDLRKTFDANQTKGEVAFNYETELYFGQLPMR